MFGKKIKGPIQFHLSETNFCDAWEGESRDCSHELCVIADADHYTLFYRNGVFLGAPMPLGGPIYPFSKDITSRGSRADKKKYLTAKVVCLSKTFNLKVYWGTKTRFTIIDKNTHKAYRVGVSGSFMVAVEPSDGGTNANLFYGKLLTQGDKMKMDTDALREKLSDLFVNRVGEQVQECIENLGRPLASLGGLQPKEFLQISNQVYPYVKDVFSDFGLTLTDESKDSVVLNFLIDPA